MHIKLKYLSNEERRKGKFSNILENILIIF